MTDAHLREQKKHLVVLVHGINTEAYWIDLVKPTLEDAGFVVAPTSYGNYTVLKFLLPFKGPRRKAADRVVRAINIAQELFKPSEISVISHSFGTYVVGHILAEHPELKWERIIFCGSVLKDTFPLFQFLYRFNPPMLNEVGSRDYWPAIAESAGWGYGSIGSRGLHDPAVSTRWHHGFRHSDFLTETFTETFWIPFLKDGRIVRGDKPTALPLRIRALTFFPLRLFVPLVLVACLAFGAAAFVGPVFISTASSDCDSTTAPETLMTRTTKFAISPTTTAGATARREWSRVINDRWVERYIDDHFDVQFNIKCRTTLQGCPGTVVYLSQQPKVRRFIPDKGCTGFWLREGDGEWGYVRQITPQDDAGR
jgi:pimeloyl-ACP methyl ester carboxylesterase